MRLLFCLICFIAAFPVLSFAQQKGDTAVIPPAKDSVTPFVRKVWAAAEHDKQRNQSSYRSDKIKIRQQAIWNTLSNTAQDVKLYLVTNADVDRIPAAMATVKQSYELLQDGIFVHKGTVQTERNLSVSSAVLYQLIAQTGQYKKRVDQYTTDLIAFRNNMDSLLSDPAIYMFPSDSIALMAYLSRLRVIAAAGDPTDNALNAKLDSAQLLQNNVDQLLFSMSASYEKIEAYRNELAGLNLKREFVNMWQVSRYDRPLPEILHFSFAKEQMALQYYTRDNLLLILVCLFLTGFIVLGVYSVKRRVRDTPQYDVIKQELILQHPVASSLIVVLSICQFAFINAPFIFSFCIWSVQIICLLMLLRGYITPFWVNFWIALATLFLLACLDNFILQASRTERWLLSILSLAGILFGAFIIRNRHRPDLKEQYIIHFVRFLVAAELLAFLLNLLGRYNLSKIFFVAGYTGTVIAILFLWVIRLINEGLRLGAYLAHSTGRKPFQLNFNRLGDKAPRILYVLLVLGWGILVGRHFYLFRRLSAPMDQFLHQERSIGDYSFSIGGIVLFMLIMVCTLVLSRIISFFADDAVAVHNNSGQSTRRVSLGSWILLIRIMIICTGLFLAFAATGFPLDKITIVLGALSVGIGLGLQGLVSNLISGLIIAFEKPVKVGDIIEVGDKTGVMKSIGFRSSTVSLRNGSNLVVPNGDLLNNRIVNWSNSKSTKKVILPLSVAYGSDLKTVKSLLEHIAGQDERILDAPAPNAIPRNFGDSAINIDLVFWVRSIGETEAVTGQLILDIDTQFREQKIVIPFPRQDVHIYTEQEKDKDESEAGPNDGLQA